MKIQVLVFMSEIKFDLTLKKKRKLLFTIIKVLPALRLSRQKTNSLSSHFAAIWSCSACLGGIILGENTYFAPRKLVQIAFKAIKRKKLA